MIQAHFFENPEGLIEVTQISPVYMEIFGQNKKYICSKEFGQGEWDKITNFPKSDSKEISEFLKSQFLQTSIQFQVHFLLSCIYSQFHKTRQLLRIAA